MWRRIERPARSLRETREGRCGPWPARRHPGRGRAATGKASNRGTGSASLGHAGRHWVGATRLASPAEENHPEGEPEGQVADDLHGETRDLLIGVGGQVHRARSELVDRVEGVIGEGEKRGRENWRQCRSEEVTH